jgi:predicted membrane-bound spermidine synthase
MRKVELPEASKGKWSIQHFEVEEPDIHSMLRGRGVRPGKYTRIMRNGTLVMSDTPAEMRDHIGPVLQAKGSCLINGLGIGLVLKNILLKDEVTDVTVVEISQDLIDIVSPHYVDDRVTFICADAFEYKPPKGKRYQMVWHDIWDNICADNIPEMAKLHRKYGRRADWQGSWCKYECRRGL